MKQSIHVCLDAYSEGWVITCRGGDRKCPRESKYAGRRRIIEKGELVFINRYNATAFCEYECAVHHHKGYECVLQQTPLSFVNRTTTW